MCCLAIGANYWRQQIPGANSPFRPDRLPHVPFTVTERWQHMMQGCVVCGEHGGHTAGEAEGTLTAAPGGAAAQQPEAEARDPGQPLRVA